MKKVTKMVGVVLVMILCVTAFAALAEENTDVAENAIVNYAVEQERKEMENAEENAFSDDVPSTIPEPEGDGDAAGAKENAESSTAADPDQAEEFPIEESDEEYNVNEEEAMTDEEEILVGFIVIFADAQDVEFSRCTVKEGELIKKPSDPIAEGYVFEHWYDKADSEKGPFLFNQEVTEDLTLCALFLPIHEDASAYEESTEEEPVGEGVAVEEPVEEDVAVEEPVEEDVAVEEPVEEEADDEECDTSAAPYVVISSSHESSENVDEGEMITLTAKVYNLSRGETVYYQWQNDISGSFKDVKGANGPKISYVANADNSGCQWRVRVSIEK